MQRIRQHLTNMGLAAMLVKGSFDAVLALGSALAGHTTFAATCAGGAVFWFMAVALVLARRYRRRGQDAVGAAGAPGVAAIIDGIVIHGHNTHTVKIVETEVA